MLSLPDIVTLWPYAFLPSCSFVLSSTLRKDLLSFFRDVEFGSVLKMKYLRHRCITNNVVNQNRRKSRRNRSRSMLVFPIIILNQIQEMTVIKQWRNGLQQFQMEKCQPNKRLRDKKRNWNHFLQLWTWGRHSRSPENFVFTLCRTSKH